MIKQLETDPRLISLGHKYKHPTVVLTTCESKLPKIDKDVNPLLNVIICPEILYSNDKN